MNAAEVYLSKLCTPEQAVALIPDGAFVIQGTAAGEPPALLRAVADRALAGAFSELRMGGLLPLQASASSILAPELRDVIHWESLFASDFDRELVRSGTAQFRPGYFYQMPRLLTEFMDIDVALICVSRVDKHGYVSLGTNVDTNKAAIEAADLVLAEVNQHMPRVHGDSWLHVSEVDAFVEHDAPLAELAVALERPEDRAIGELIAAMVPNGATIQLGIGGVPNAVAQALMGHRNLGIHTEMFVDSMVDLIEGGVANGSQKTFHPGKALYAFAWGSRRMYEFLDDNPVIEAHSVSYTNFPPNIARNDHMISVNSTIEVDLMGQCCSESMGMQQYSGTGGQHDFARGAFDSRGGHSIIAFYSTARGGEVSRIVPMLQPGAIVTTPRNEVHWLATEYGLACLKGLSTRERARALIGLAHPKFRDGLSAAAQQLHYL
ncbi:MAG: 4-hydroxybutyrate--acetyl-CoA CoA transferase [Chloroflexi bacterium]|nr:4-hydroxybutyrate--acetyl-CoA CoA transferase [Chloroflexota bacterium]MQC27978.1 acetyl-CoA hydrolase/transferase family protein [Chloroflexota bacterium]